MATYIQTFEKTIPANAVEVKIGDLTPKEGEKYHLVAIGIKISASGSITGYFEREKQHIFSYNLQPDANHMVPIDTTITAGATFSWVGTDTSGAANLMGVIVVYEILPL